MLFDNLLMAKGQYYHIILCVVCNIIYCFTIFFYRIGYLYILVVVYLALVVILIACLFAG